MVKLEDLQVDTHVAGIGPSASVKVLYLKKAGEDAADVTYELLDGRVLKKTLFRADEAKLSVAREARTWAFEAKLESFELAAEKAEQLKKIEEGHVDEASVGKSISELHADHTLLKGFQCDAQDVLKSGVHRKSDEFSKNLEGPCAVGVERQTQLREEAGRSRAPESHDGHRDHGLPTEFVAPEMARAGAVGLQGLSGPDECKAARHSDSRRGSAENRGREGGSP